MTRLQFVRIEAVLVDLDLRAHRARESGDVAGLAEVEADRAHLLQVVADGRPLAEITVDGAHDEPLEKLLQRFEAAEV